MNQRLSAGVSTTPTSKSARDKRPFLLWPLLIVAAIVVIFALSLESSLKTDERIALFPQSGPYP
jgi:hypothetical protein